ncbi:MlaD family protein [Actinocorallia aurantiaca]|uniref:Phospholipid/cholesterol/gamma-HCH transport system substrate-binding protein n=1 Tax=Actinocorallia aurantiaca TaxID=46204 RepID=A0ABN3ULQ9_9ACTN
MNLDQLSKGPRLLVTAATAAVLAVSLHLVVAKPFEEKGIALSAHVGNASQGLNSTSPVKLRGVTVGRVERIELAGTSGAKLTLRLDPGVRVPDSATAAVEPESVFGPKFVNLIPGEHEGTGPYLADGQDIVRTSESGDLGHLLVDAEKALAAVDPADVAIIFDTLSTALAGQGDHVRGLVDNAGTLVDVAHDHRQDARRFIEDLARLARLRGVGEDVGTLVAAGDDTLRTLNSGEDRVKNLAIGVAEAGDTVESGFTGYGGGLTQGVRSAERAVSLIRGQLGIAGPSLRTIIDLMPIYRALGFAPIGEKKRMLAVNIVLPSDPCQMFLGVCPMGDVSDTSRKKTKKKRGGS